MIDIIVNKCYNDYVIDVLGDSATSTIRQEELARAYLLTIEREPINGSTISRGTENDYLT